MDEDFKNAAETVYFLVNAILVAMQIQEKIKKQQKKPPVNRKSKKRK
nr:MAG TPA: hypothetical protein [Caudoviricetes sp.]